jgi:hypothetical protein
MFNKSDLRPILLGTTRFKASHGYITTLADGEEVKQEVLVSFYVNNKGHRTVEAVAHDERDFTDAVLFYEDHIRMWANDRAADVFAACPCDNPTEFLLKKWDEIKAKRAA